LVNVDALMNRKTFLPIFLFLVFAGCFSAEKRDDNKQSVVYANHESVPAAKTPGEAVRQLMEGNARHARGESRWLQLSSSQATLVKPFVFVINATGGHVVPEEILDLPRGSLTLMNWQPGGADMKALNAGVEAGIKVVLVLLPFAVADWPDMTTTATPPDSRTKHTWQTIYRQLQASNSKLARVFAERRCELVGGMLHPLTKRLLFLSPSN